MFRAHCRAGHVLQGRTAAITDTRCRQPKRRHAGTKPRRPPVPAFDPTAHADGGRRDLSRRDFRSSPEHPAGDIRSHREQRRACRHAESQPATDARHHAHPALAPRLSRQLPGHHAGVALRKSSGGYHRGRLRRRDRRRFRAGAGNDVARARAGSHHCRGVARLHDGALDSPTIRTSCRIWTGS